MYAMRYGTVPVVRNTGGLKDTVIDYEDPGGYGIKFNNASIGDLTQSIWRSVQLFKDNARLKTVRDRMMKLDFSWEKSVTEYISLYHSLK
jgi:starch synthase